MVTLLLLLLLLLLPMMMKMMTMTMTVIRLSVVEAAFCDSFLTLCDDKFNITTCDHNFKKLRRRVSKYKITTKPGLLIKGLSTSAKH